MVMAKVIVGQVVIATVGQLAEVRVVL